MQQVVRVVNQPGIKDSNTRRSDDGEVDGHGGEGWRLASGMPTHETRSSWPVVDSWCSEKVGVSHFRTPSRQRRQRPALLGPPPALMILRRDHGARLECFVFHKSDSIPPDEETDRRSKRTNASSA